MKITIPKKFQKCLAADPKWKRRTEILTDALSDVLSQATDFFPEYTDHGVGHVNTVLELAAELIPGKSISSNTLSARDAACLVAAIAIHDLGMFLTPAGLNILMTKDWDSHRNEKLDKYSWAEAWERYVSETKRLPQARMLRCFGRMIEVEKTTLVKENMTWDDKLVIGEFLRRNHPRLAQEIAKAGLPGSTVQHFLEDSGFTAVECRVIGQIARSHGMSLREVENHLGPSAYHSNMPVYYLMSILRLADLLDAGEGRAPMIRIRQEDLGSPLSKEEWALNRCFHIDSSAWYPEIKNYTVTATPETSSEYARLEKWLENAQRELDLCWAALAEKYPEGKLKLSIHRVKCTMHEPLNHEEISDRILPREVKVTANPEIVKLMIEPLYGDDPTYGVRELLQNAVDACVERKEWECKHGNPDYKGFVDVRVVGDTFTITDNGMGMNEDILLNYYLSAGSSYRNSEAWKAANAPEGESQVARTGKFGVGFLAAFLLGDEVEIHTQHREDRKGYWFKFDQRSMPLDVEREVRQNPYATAEDDHTGTTIIIKLKDIAREKWNDGPNWYNWYAFDEPEVRYTIQGEEMYYQGVSLRRKPAENPDWFVLPTDEYETYLWKPDMHTDTAEFYCNGIWIGNYWNKLDGYGLDVNMPYVSVIDKNGKLDVNLSRKWLKSFPEKDDLCKAVFHWCIARLLLTPWENEKDYFQNLTNGFALSNKHYPKGIPFLLSSRGFTLNCKSLLTGLHIDECVLLTYEGQDLLKAFESARCFVKNVPCTILGKGIREDYRFYFAEKMGSYYFAGPLVFLNRLLDDVGKMFTADYQVSKYVSSCWIHSDALSTVRKNNPHLLESTCIKVIRENLTGISLRDSFDMPIRACKFSIDQFPAAVHLVLEHDDSSSGQNSDSLFFQTMKEILIPAENYSQDDIWIPFDMEERKTKFPNAFRKLDKYINHIRMETEREAQFNTFKANHAQEISELLELINQDDPQIFWETVPRIIAAAFLKQPWCIIPVKYLGELEALCLLLFGVDKEKLATANPIKDPEAIARFLFNLYNEMDEDTLKVNARDDADTAAMLDALIRLRNTLPPM